MSVYRETLAGGDLIREVRSDGFLAALLMKDDWKPYRNLSEEVRYLEDRESQLKLAYEKAREELMVARTNVGFTISMLGKYKGNNSEVSYEIPEDFSILEKYDHIRYGNSNREKSGGKDQNQNGKSGGGDGNNNQKSNKDNSNNNKQNNGRKPMTLRELFENVKVVH